MDTNNNNDATRTRPRWFGPAMIALVLLLVAVAGWTIRNLTTDESQAQAPQAPAASTAPTQGEAEAAAPASASPWYKPVFDYYHWLSRLTSRLSPGIFPASSGPHLPVIHSHPTML